MELIVMKFELTFCHFCYKLYHPQIISPTNLHFCCPYHQQFN